MANFVFQLYLEERFFALGIHESVIPSSCMIETKSGEVNILLPLDARRAEFQDYRCLTKTLEHGDKWEIYKPSKGQSDFVFLKEDKTLSIHVRFVQKGTYRLEIIGKEKTRSECDLNEFDWVALYRVEVKELDKEFLFPKKEGIGWGPGEKLAKNGLKAFSHREGMIRFYPEDELFMEFSSLEGYASSRIRLRYRLALKNGEVFQEPTRRPEEVDWFSRDNGVIKIRGK